MVSVPLCSVQTLPGWHLMTWGGKPKGKQFCSRVATCCEIIQAKRGQKRAEPSRCMEEARLCVSDGHARCKDSSSPSPQTERRKANKQKRSRGTIKRAKGCPPGSGALSVTSAAERESAALLDSGHGGGRSLKTSGDSAAQWAEKRLQQHCGLLTNSSDVICCNVCPLSGRGRDWNPALCLSGARI